MAGHDGTVRVAYTSSATHGRHLRGVDDTHAHLNMPATFVFARGLETSDPASRSSRRTGRRGKVATQLFPTPDPSTFTAPNLQYFMDSPTEVPTSSLRPFGCPVRDRKHPPVPRVDALSPSPSTSDELARGVEELVREDMAVFGEIPVFDAGAYTFVPTTGRGSRATAWSTATPPRLDDLASEPRRRPPRRHNSHEFFHAWNVERIRPRCVEPFDFDARKHVGRAAARRGIHRSTTVRLPPERAQEIRPRRVLTHSAAAGG